MSSRPRKPTMWDIGAQAGVSQATVSLVMNNAPSTRISAATRARVLEAARALGYEKARRPDTQGGVIGFMIDTLTASQHVPALIEGARAEAAESDHLLVVVPTGNSADADDAAIDYLFARPLIGVIYASLITQAVNPPRRLRDVPTVLLNCHSPKNDMPAVVPGDVAGGYAATEALIRAGHRRIAMINGEHWIEAGRDRETGYRQALASYDVAVNPDYVRHGGWTHAAGRMQAEALLDLPVPPTAMFCYCDRMALGVYDAVKARGLSIPEDISVVGYDDEAFAADMAPPLTTVVLPHEAMGRWAATTLLDGGAELLSNRKHRRTKIACDLVVRGSIAPPR